MSLIVYQEGHVVGEWFVGSVGTILLRSFIMPKLPQNMIRRD